MPTTVPTIVCGRCGTPFVNTAVCGNCAHPTTATWPFDAEEWRTRLRLASQERVILALALDALCLLVPVVALAVAATRSGWHPWAIALVVVTLLAMLSGLGLWCLRDWGRFAGGAALRLRTLDSLTGLAPARPMAPRRLLVADSRGDDPLLITVRHLGDPRTIAKPPSPVPVAAPPAPPAPRSPGCYVATSQKLTPLVGPLLVGRYPVRQIGAEPLPTLELPDFTRTMSRAHVLLENENGHLWATDLDSGNGTRLRRPGEQPVAMVPRMRMPIITGTRIDCGEQSLLITDGRRVA